MIIASMDLSLTSPAIIVANRQSALSDGSFPPNPNILKIHFATEVAKLAESKGGWRYRPSEKGLSKKTEEYRLGRLHFLYSKIAGSMMQANPDYVAIEDYGFVGKGAGFYPAELIGMVKHWLWMRNVPLRLYDPQAIKMFTTGKGNAQKEEMIDVVQKRWNALFEIHEYGRSANDVADAIGILYLLHAELCARENPQLVPSMKDATRRVLNRVTKANPENILVRPFITRGEMQ